MMIGLSIRLVLMVHRDAYMCIYHYFVLTFDHNNNNNNNNNNNDKNNR